MSVLGFATGQSLFAAAGAYRSDLAIEATGAIMPAPVPPLSTMGIGAAIERAGAVAADYRSCRPSCWRAAALRCSSIQRSMPVLNEASVATAAHRGQGTAAGGAIDPAPRDAQSLGDVVGIS